MSGKARWIVAVAAGLAIVAAQAAEPTPEQRREQIMKLGWVEGPTHAGIGDKAAIDTPAQTRFLPERDGERFLELTGNLPEPGNSVLVGSNWWATFAFSPVGYVKDDEKLDADALLKQIRSGDEPSNEERRKRGLPQLWTEGWFVPPHYDEETKRLEWGLRLRSEGSSEPGVNYTVRVLGRTGYESVILVSSPETLNQDVKELKAILKTFDFKPGEKYAEFKQGDRVAQFGLGALIVGGAAAVAAKSGLWKSLLAALAAGWKLVAAAGVALFAGIAKLFGRRRA